ncbi:TPA: thiol peroxidase [Campylobacter jejuni]
MKTKIYTFIVLIILLFAIPLIYFFCFDFKQLDDKEKIEKISKFYKEKLKNIPNLEISFLEKNNDFPFEAYIFEFKTNTEKTKELIFVKDNYFFTDYVDFKTLELSKNKVQELLSKDKHKNILKELEKDKQYIVSLGNGKNQVYVFSDPECPFCQKHLKTIDEEFLKKNTIHFIFISVHNNFKIIASLYKELENKHNDDEKLKIINHFYFEKPDYEKISPEKENEMRGLFHKYLNLEVNYTPFIINREK